MEFQSKKAMRRSYMRNLTGIFAEFFMYFLSCYTPKEHRKIPALSELNWYFDGNFTPLVLLIETFAEKIQIK